MAQNTRIFVSKLSIPGKANDELSYVFSEKIAQGHESVGIFGIFSIRGVDEVYRTLITETVKHFLDFYHRSLKNPTDSLADTVDDSREFLFENAIQYTNEHVSDALVEHIDEEKKSHSFDVRRVHFTIGVINGDSLFLSSTGTSIHAYYIYPVFRKSGFSHYAVVDIGESQKNKDESPRLFSTLVSGKVSVPGGVISICNQSFLDYISLDQLKHAMTNMPIHVLSSYFQGLLGKINAKNDFSALFINPAYNGPVTAVEKQHLTASNVSMHDLNNTEEGTRNILSPAIVPMIQKTALTAGKGIGAVARFIVQAARFVGARIKKIPFSKIASAPRALRDIDPGKRLAVVLHTLPSLRPRLQRIVEKVDMKKIGALGPLIMRGIRRGILAPFIKIVLFSKNAFMDLPRVSKIFMVLGAIFFFLFVQSIFMLSARQQNQKREIALNESLKSIEQKNDLAEASILYDDEQKARDVLSQAEQMLAQIPIEKDTVAKLAPLHSRIDSIKTKLRHVTPVKLGMIASIETSVPSHDAARLDMSGSTLVLYTPDALYTLKNGKISEVDTQAKIPSIRCGALANPLTFVACTGDANRMVRVDLKTTKTSPLSLSFAPKETQISVLHIYNKRAYVFDSHAGSLFRHDADENGYAIGTDWIKERHDLSGVSDFAIDGTVYMVANRSALLHFEAGRLTQFALPSLDPPAHDITHVWADPDQAYLYILEPAEKRIIVLDKEKKKIVTQLTADAFASALEMRADKTKKRIVVLTNTALFDFPFEVK